MQEHEEVERGRYRVVQKSPHLEHYQTAILIFGECCVQAQVKRYPAQSL
jgi:hypothetical protein